MWGASDWMSLLPTGNPATCRNHQVCQQASLPHDHSIWTQQRNCLQPSRRAVPGHDREMKRVRRWMWRQNNGSDRCTSEVNVVIRPVVRSTAIKWPSLPADWEKDSYGWDGSRVGLISRLRQATRDRIWVRDWLLVARETRGTDLGTDNVAHHSSLDSAWYQASYANSMRYLSCTVCFTGNDQRTVKKIEKGCCISGSGIPSVCRETPWSSFDTHCLKVYTADAFHLMWSAWTAWTARALSFDANWVNWCKHCISCELRELIRHFHLMWTDWIVWVFSCHVT